MHATTPITSARPDRIRAAGAGSRILMSGLLVLLLLGAARTAAAQVIDNPDILIERTSGDVFYFDTSKNLRAAYSSFRIVNNTATPLQDIVAQIHTFVGPTLGLADHEDGLFSVGDIPVGGSASVFFYLEATNGEYLSPQQYTVSLGSGSLANVVDERVFTTTSVQETIAANANKVDSVRVTPNPPSFGQPFTIKVYGRTGILGDGRMLRFSPATYLEWPADSFELRGAHIDFVGTGYEDWTDQLFGMQPIKAATDYVATYTFLVTGSTDAAAPVSPVGYLSSGVQMKHTDTGNFATLPPVMPPVVTDYIDLAVDLAVDEPAPPAGTEVLYTVSLTNELPQVLTATGVQVEITTLPGLTSTGYDFATDASGYVGLGTYDPGTGIWSLSGLLPGETVTLQLPFYVPDEGETGYGEGTLLVAEVVAAGEPDVDSTPDNGDTSEDDYAELGLTVGPGARIDLSLDASVDQPTPVEGTNTTVTLTVTNDASAALDATGVTADVTLPAGYAFVSATGDGSFDEVGGVWTIGGLVAGASASLDIVLTAPLGDFTASVVSAEVSAADQPDADSTPGNADTAEDDYDSVTITPIPTPYLDLSLEASVDNPAPQEGTNVTVALTVANDASADVAATGVTAEVTIPAGFTFVSATGDGSFDDATGTWTIGTVAVAGSASIGLVLTAPLGAFSAADLTAEVLTASPEDVDSTPGNGVDTEDDYDSVTITPVATPVIDLSLSSDASALAPVEGTSTTVTLTLTNDAAADLGATGVQVAVNIPAGLPLEDYDWTLDLGGLVSHGTFDPVTGIWTVGDLAIGESATLQLPLYAPAEGEPGYGGSTTLTAEVLAANEPDADSTPGNAAIGEDDYTTITISPVPPDRIDLAVDVTVDDPNAKAGTVTSFHVTVTNESGADMPATGVELYTVIPAGLLAIPYDYGTDAGGLVGQGTYDPNSGIWTVGTLAVGADATLEIAVRVPDEWDAGYGESTLFEAEVRAANEPDSDSIPNNGANAEDDYDSETITPALGDRIDLELTVTPSTLEPERGTTVTYLLTVTNAPIPDRDPLTATGVEVYAFIPEGTPVYPDDYLSTPNGQASQGSFDFGTQTWNVGTLASGESATLELILYVPTPSESSLGYGGSELFWTEVSAAVEPDVDSTPANYPIVEDDSDEVNLAPSSGGGNAGIESNGTMAGQLAQLLFDRSRTTGDDAPLAPFASNVVAAKSGGASSSDLLRVLIPQTGPAASRAYETSPRDLLPITNADDVVAADFLREVDGSRIGAFFGALTTGELYEHTKVICDRLRGGVLGQVGEARVAGRPFLVSRIDHESGAVDYAISMNVFRQGDGFVVDSRFRLDEYDAPSSTDDVLNLQVWSKNRLYTLRMAEQVLERLGELGPVTYRNEPDHAPIVPDVYVRTGRYRDGVLELELFNGAGVDRVRLTGGSYALSERGDRIAFDKEVALPPADDRGVVRVRLPLGPVFDATFFVETPDGTRDQMYLADGAWSYSFDGAGARVGRFDITPVRDITPHEGIFTVERAAGIRGDVKTWAVLYRYLRANGQPVDLSDYDYVEFTASGEGQVQVLFEKASVTDGEQFGTVIRLGDEPKTYRFRFDELRRADGSGRLTAEDLVLVSFYVHGDKVRERPFDLKVDNLRFGGAAGDPLAEVPDQFELEQNYPNPFNPQTQIAFGLPTADHVRLTVYDVLGRQVATLLDGFVEAGRHEVRFDASDFSSGTYLYRLETGERTVTKTMTLLR